jgi:hypothetical protein
MLQLFFANVIVDYYGSHVASFVLTQSKSLWVVLFCFVAVITLHLNERGALVTREKAGQ